MWPPIRSVGFGRSVDACGEKGCKTEQVTQNEPQVSAVTESKEGTKGQRENLPCSKTESLGLYSIAGVHGVCLPVFN